MSEVKKWCFVIIVIVAIASMLLMAGCEEAKETVVDTKETAKETVAESTVKGEIYENSKFSIPVPDGWIVLDQIRTIDKIRLKEKASHLREIEIIKIKSVLKEMLVD